MRLLLGRLSAPLLPTNPTTQAARIATATTAIRTHCPQTRPYTMSTHPSGLNVTPLVENGWAVGETAVHKTFRFKGFKKCWQFMDLVAAECVIQKHHPEWSNVYNTTFVRWTTHSPPGLSEKDVLMAKFCDEKAEECGGVKDVGEGSKIEDLANTGVKEGGDCCVPKKKEGNPQI